MRLRTAGVLAALVAAVAATLDPSGAVAGAGSAAGPRPVPGGVQPTPFDTGAAVVAGQQAGPPPRIEARENVSESFYTYRVYATFYEPTTPGNIEVAIPDKCVKFAHRRDTNALRQHNCSPDYAIGLDYRVIVTRDNGAQGAFFANEVGPWNVDDNYWNSPSGPRPRRRFTDLPRGKPEAEAAWYNEYNSSPNCLNLDGSPANRADGADQFGRCVLNPAGVDLSFDAGRQLGLNPGQNEWVTVSFAWEPIRNRVQAVHSGKSMDVQSGSTADGAAVIQWSSHGGQNQQWRFDRLDNGAYRIVSIFSGKVLDVNGGSQADGAPVIQWSWHGGPNQQWRLEARPDGDYRVLNVHSGKSLDVGSGSQADGARVIQWAPHDGPNQRWRRTVLG